MHRKWRNFKKLYQLKQQNQSNQNQNIDGQPFNTKDQLSSHLNENITSLRTIYENCSDVVFRPFLIEGKDKAVLIYIEGLSNVEEINDNVLTPLMEIPEQQQLQQLTMQAEQWEFNNFSSFLEKKISISNIKEVQTVTDVINQISSGNPVILVDQKIKGFSVGLAKWEKRAIEEPSAESVIRGPREGFIETIGVNIALLRRKIRSPKLKMEQMEVGRVTKTSLVLAYIDGLVDQTLIEEAKNRLNRIDTDSVLESSYIEEFIEDNPFSPFPQLLNTERADVVSSYLLEGHIAILVDGSPFVLVAPTTFYSLMQASEDYYQRPMLSTAIRWLRYLFIVISLLLPSLYVAVLTYHHEMVPTTLLISMAASREPIPFPAVVEALLMEILFEILREAGIRLPKQIGAAVSIVGALVIGQAAVEAGIVSAPMVMVVAVTGIASFSIPRYNAGMALRMLRFPMLILAGILGLLGIMLGIIMIVTHLCTLRSFGVPYLSPMAPMKGPDMKDVMLRLPRWTDNTRPHLTGEYNKYRQAPGQKPDPTRGVNQ
ncbi:spore germination protein [Alkalihalobacillus sp. BA299]|uniref:spore germination protein n=1 Tax=Alkalihalobacillus sp. BA299 TaxID=2815938 RepID=UPI001ADD25CA|nr:spore germination protein [Alkalihalobacillus sp. BA299]